MRSIDHASDVDDSVRCKWLADGAASLPELAQRLRVAADGLDEQSRDGLCLAGAVTDDYGHLRRGGPEPAFDGEPAGLPLFAATEASAGWPAEITINLKWTADGCETLPEVAARLRTNADECDRRHLAGERLIGEIEDGHGQVQPAAG